MRGPIERLGRLIAEWGRRSDQELHEQLEAVEAFVGALGLEDARRRAIEVVENSEWYQVIASAVGPDEAPLLELLPTTTREFFERFPEVRGRYSDARVALHLTEPSLRFPDLIKIGDDVEFTEVLVAPDGRVMPVGPDEDLQGAESYDSIYHWILVMTAAVHLEFAETLL